MTVSYIALASVTSDSFSKTASDIIKETIKFNMTGHHKILKLIHKNGKNKDRNRYVSV